MRLGELTEKRFAEPASAKVSKVRALTLLRSKRSGLQIVKSVSDAGLTSRRSGYCFAF